MASWHEINEMTRNPSGCRDLARRLFDVHGQSVNEWELGFLESIAGKTAAEQFTTRQVEKLLQIRDGLEPVKELYGFNLADLLKRVYEARLDLSDDDEEWIAALWAKRDETYMRRRAGLRLLRCARQLGIVESAFA